MRLPQYSGKDYVVLAYVVLPITLIINSNIFGSSFFESWDIFLPSTFLTATLFALGFIGCGSIAAFFKRRMPEEKQSSLRLFLMILCFVALSGVFLMTLFNGYEAYPGFDYTFNKGGFVWAYVIMAIFNIFITLLMEGIYRYHKWKENLRDTEEIRKTFAQSQLLNLKSPVNPHFLFNSLNTLSSLINDDEAEAEKFLNEMTKVYRYMLRVDDEQLVTLQTELKFISSYTFLLEKRFGQSLQVQIDVKEEDREKLIPSSSLQVLIENAFTQNSMCKTDPLIILIRSYGHDKLLVKNTRKPKMICDSIDVEASLDNLVTKYRLLNASTVTIRDDEDYRSVFLPLIENKGELV